MNWKSKKVFITGGSGFIGSKLTFALHTAGANVFALEHKKEFPGHINKFKGDITNIDEDFKKCVSDFEPEVVFHLAAQPLVSAAMEDVCGTVDTNVKGTADILCLLKEIKSLKSLVFISTDKVYGNVSPITKDTIPAGTDHPYNASKLAGDQLAQMYSKFLGIPTVIIRNANVYGSGDVHYDRIVPRTIRNIIWEESPVVRGDGTNTRDYIHVSEVVSGYMRAAEVPYTNQFTAMNLCGKNYSVIQVIDTILGKMGRVDLAPRYEGQWKGEIPHQHIENDTAKDLIDWNPKIDLELGLEMTIPWYKENIK